MAEIEDRWRELGEFIREQRGQLSLRKVSEMAGISNPYLSQIERGLRKPSAEILRQIAGALQISAETLYVRAGILDEPDGTHDLEGAISRDPYLDEEHKKTLLHIYRSFRTAFIAAHGDPLVIEPHDPGDGDPGTGTDDVEGDREDGERDEHDDSGAGGGDRPEVATGDADDGEGGPPAEDRVGLLDGGTSEPPR
jgi:transcriptional regulator with XRE-family HTH domain